MESAEKTLKKLLESRGKIIKNAKVFDRGYLPLSLVETDKINSLFKEVATIVKYERSKNVLICGESGTGKTVAMRVAERIVKETLSGNMKEKSKFVYINCRDKSTVDILGSLLGKESTGFSENKLTLQFIDSVHNTNLNLILVLDEVDRAEKISNLLYSLSRTKEVYPSFSGSISLILIANDKKWEEQLDKPVRSSLQLKTIVFGLYSITKIQRILQERIKEGFFSSSNSSNITGKNLYYIAKHTVEKRQSDVRFAIESLFRSAQRAEESGRTTISEKDISCSFVTVEEDLEREKITTLSTNQFLVLYSYYYKDETNFSEAYQLYMQRVKDFRIQRVQKIGHTMFRRITDYLESQNLIRKIFVAHEIGKREIKHSGKIKKDILEKEFVQRMERAKI